jgi:hypothetical protein
MSTGATGATNGAAVFDNSGGATPTASYSGMGYYGGERSAGTSQSASTQPAPPPSTSTVSGLTPSSSPDSNAVKAHELSSVPDVEDYENKPAEKATKARATVDPASKEASGENVCCLCDEEINVKLQPCGHAVMCFKCSHIAKRCPICTVSHCYQWSHWWEWSCSPVC